MKSQIPKTTVLLTVILVAFTTSSHADEKPRFEFTRIIAHWARYADPDYLKFVAEAEPEVCQIGFYGGHFYALSHTPQYKGYPAHFPVRGLDECGQWFEKRNADIHRLGAKVVGHFNMTFLVGDPGGPKGPRGFFKYYRELWDEKTLGKRPIDDPMKLLARNADGSPMSRKNYSIGGMREYTACLNNPHWRQVLKAWAKRGIGRGVDGYMINYFYRHNCLCEHCQAGFRAYLAERFTAKDLKRQFAIDDVKRHRFKEIVGWHDPKKSTSLRREMLRWSQISTKLAFDDVFVKYARSLKPGLLLGQWNHLGNFNQISGDERCMLPAELWGRDEDYAWYSTGSSAFFTDLQNGIFGEGTLQARYIRGAFNDKPFTLGKYENTRIRVAIAELAANGGAPMGFYTRYHDPDARKEIVRYYQFLKKYDNVYRANRSYSEVLLLFPRSRIHQGDVAAVDAFRRKGKELLDQHFLFDVKPDDLVPGSEKAELGLMIKSFGPRGISRFVAPKTVRVSASQPRDESEITLHFVNYNREEPAKPRSAGRGIQDEKPIAVKSVVVDFLLPKEAKVARVLMATPEAPKSVPLRFAQADGRVRFTVPQFLVYAIARIQMAKR